MIKLLGNRQKIGKLTVGAGRIGNSSSVVNEDIDVRQDIFPGQIIGLAVNVQELKIITNDNFEIDLLEVYDGIAVKEGMYLTFIQGVLKIVDPVGGLEKFAIRGGERLHVKISKSNGDVIIWRRDLIVTKIGVADFDIMNNKTSYELSFASSAFVYGLRKKLYDSFSSKPIVEVVQNMYNEITRNSLFIEDPKLTLGDTFYQCGGKRAHEVIVDMSKRACSKNRFFVFFERFIPIYGTTNDLNGERTSFSTPHYFGSVEKLIEDSEDGFTYNIIFKRETLSGLEPNYIRAFSFRRLESFRHIEALNKGFYGTEFTSINIIGRKCKNDFVSYFNSDNVRLHRNRLVGENNIFVPQIERSDRRPGNKVFVASMNDPINRESWLKHEHIKRIESVFFKVAIEIAGATNNIGVGNVINLSIPSAASRSMSPIDSLSRLDPIHSGKYIVTGVDHIIRNGQYLKNLELSRDSIPFNYNEATENQFIE